MYRLLICCGVLFAQTSSDLVVRIEVNLVQVDAVVTNGKNQPVADLTAADFEIRQDGKLQPIRNFAYIGASAGSQGALLPPPVDLKPADVRRTFAIVVDDLAAIVTTGGGMGIFQAIHCRSKAASCSDRPRETQPLLQPSRDWYAKSLALWDKLLESKHVPPMYAGKAAELRQKVRE